MVRPGPVPRRRYLAAGYLLRARSLEQLAGLLEVPAETLARAVDANNQYAATGEDLDFGRGTSPYHRYLGYPRHGPNPCIGRIANPPFFPVREHPRGIGPHWALR